MRATSEVLEDNKVKIAVEIDEDEVEAGVADAAKQLARQVRIPGFRPGKAPRQVVEARLGGARALRDEALREILPDYYARAISATEVEPISAPELNVTSGQEEGGVEFDAIVEVRPQVHLTGHGALRVTIPSPIATDEELDQLLDNLRDTDAVLTEVSRPIVTGDYVTVDARGKLEDGEEVVNVDDYVYVVGQGTFVDAADDQLPGMRAGETLEVEGTAPGGTQMSYVLTLKEVKEKVLPELTDEWVAENSEFETAQALRDAYLERIRLSKRAQARRVMREATLAELASQVADADAPESLVESEARERFEELRSNLERQSVSIEQFMEITHQTPEDLVAAMRDDALRAVKVDLALRAVAAEEELGADDEALDEEIVTLSGQVGRTPAQLRDELARNGRLGSLRAETTKRRAADWVLERVTYVDETGAEIDRAALEEPDEPPTGTDGDDDGAPGDDEPLDRVASDETEEPM
jgi:trigger factor